MQKRKKVSSYSRYFAYLTGKIALETTWIVLFLGTVFCILATLLSGIWALFGFLFPENFVWTLPFVLFGGSSWAMFRIAKAASRRSDAMQPVILPTRANIEQLPAAEVLLRMAQEPSTPQKQILLRPAGASDITPQTELLRSSAPH